MLSKEIGGQTFSYVGKDIEHRMPTEHNDNKRRAEKPNQERTETRHTD